MKYVAYNVLLTKDPKIINDLFYEEAPLSKTLDDVVRDTNNNTDNATFVIAPNAVNSSNFISLESSFEGEGKSYVSLRLVETKQLLEFFTVAPNSWVEGTLSRMKEESILLAPEDQIMKLSRARSTFYLTFGVGSDIKTWTGPFAINIADAKLSMSQDGVRELEVMFTPTVDSIKVFTNRILNDISYRSKDSPFNDIESRAAPGKSSATASIVVDMRAGEVVQNERQTTFTGGLLEDIGGIESSFVPDFVTEQARRVAKSMRGEQIRLSRPKIPSQETVGNERYREKANKQVWNFYVRALILKYLKNLFITVPRGNILVLFNDDLDKENDSEPLIIEPALKTKGAQKYQMDVMRRCKENLNKLGITISVSKQNGSAGRSSRNETTSTIVQNTTGQDGAVDSGDASHDPTRATPSNSDRIAESRPSEMNKLVLSMSVSVDGNRSNGESPVLLQPLVKFQRRLAEAMNDRPRDFTVYEETDFNIVKLLHENGLIENVKEPVIVFGRKSSIFKLLYNFDRQVDSKLIMNCSPYNLMQVDKKQSADIDGWSKYRSSFIEFFEKNSKLRVSSFREKLDLYSVTSKGGGTSLTYTNGVLDNDPKSPVGLIFAHNVTNGNVLSLSFDSKPYVGVLMGYANRASYKLIDEFKKYSNYQIERDPSFNFPFIEYVEKEIKRLKENNQNESFYKLFEKLFEGDQKAITMQKLLDDPVAQGFKESSFFDLLLLKLSSNVKGEYTVENRVEQKAMGKKEADLIQDINKSIINVNIRTLPFFNSNIRIGSRALLYGKSNYVIGSRIASEDNSLAIYSNFYDVVGFRHYMDKSDAYSQFTLVQSGYQEGSVSDLTIGERFEEQLKKAKEKLKKEAEEAEAQERRIEGVRSGEDVSWTESLLTAGGGFVVRKLAPEKYERILSFLGLNPRDKED
jgi:hypothetical protein